MTDRVYKWAAGLIMTGDAFYAAVTLNSTAAAILVLLLLSWSLVCSVHFACYKLKWWRVEHASRVTSNAV